MVNSKSYDLYNPWIPLTSYAHAWIQIQLALCKAVEFVICSLVDISRKSLACSFPAIDHVTVNVKSYKVHNPSIPSTTKFCYAHVLILLVVCKAIEIARKSLACSAEYHAVVNCSTDTYSMCNEHGITGDILLTFIRCMHLCTQPRKYLMYK